MNRAKKKKITAIIARIFAVVTAVLVLALFIVRDVKREDLKDKRDSLTQAEALYQTHYEQTDNAALRSEEETFGRLSHPMELRLHNVQDPPPAPDIRDLEQGALRTLNDAQQELYFVSEMIDALPPSAALPPPSTLTAGYLRNRRDEHRVRLEQVANSWSTLGVMGDGSEERQRKVYDVYKTVYEEHLGLRHEGVLAAEAAKHELKVMEGRIDTYSTLIVWLGGLAGVLAVLAAVFGLTLESSDI